VTDFLAFSVVGIVSGCIYAVAASGLVVTYTTSGIFNFAHGAIGMVMAFVYWELSVNQGWPTALALVVVLFVLAPLSGAVIERVLMRRLHGQSTGVALVVTLGLLAFLYGLAVSVWDPGRARVVPQFFRGHDVELAGVIVSYHQLTVVGIAALTALGLRLLLFRTRIGIAMRAVVDDRELAALNGGAPERVAQLSWALGAMLAALAGILLAPLLRLEALVLTLLVVNGYAAAMLGRLRSLPLTFVGAIVLGLAEAHAIGYGSRFAFLTEIKTVLPTLFLFAILVALPHARLRVGRVVTARAPRVPSFRTSAVASVLFVASVVLLSYPLSASWRFNVSQALALALLMLSLVLLTGYGGQVSLCQLSFAGVGAFAMGQVAGTDSPLGLLLAAVAAGLVGLLVALPALRLQGLYLALSTLAFALVMEQVVFDWDKVFDQGGRLELGRLDLFGLSFNGERGQMVLLAVAFVLAGMAVLAVRRGPFGRRLQAMSDSPAASATLGLNLVATKATVFAASAALAGVAGALYGGLRSSVGVFDFTMLQSLFLFLAAMVGGITTVTGAAIGGAILAILPVIQQDYFQDTNLNALGVGLFAIMIARNPHGFAGFLSPAADRVRAWWRGLSAGPGAPEPAVATAAGAAPPEKVAVS